MLPVGQVDTREQLQNITQLRVVNYRYDDQFAEAAGLPLDQRIDTGVLAQELNHVLPDAVLETGDVILPTGETIPNLLVVNKVRVKLLFEHGHAVESRTSDREVAGSNPTRSCCVPTPIHRAITLGSVNEYQRKLGSKRAHHAMQWPVVLQLRLMSG